MMPSRHILGRVIGDMVASGMMHGASLVDQVAEKMLEVEQVPCPVVHRFGPGIYIREMTVDTGVVVVGHEHKFAHVCNMMTGRAIFLNDDGSTVELTAPQTFIAKPGAKIAYVLETMVFQNVYATDETDIETLEAHYLNKSEVWNKHLEGREKLLQLSHDTDVEDFKQAIADFGFTEDEVWAISRNEADMVALPYGSFKIKVGSSPIHGRGLFATADIEPHEVFAPARIGDRRTIAGRYTNHSATPNAIMMKGPNGNLYLVAIKPIGGCRGGHDGDEITIDYRLAMRLALQNAAGE